MLSRADSSVWCVYFGSLGKASEVKQANSAAQIELFCILHDPAAHGDIKDPICPEGRSSVLCLASIP